MAEVTVTLKNDPAEMPRLIEAVESFCDAAALPPKLAMQLSVVVDELVSNVVKYGYDDGRDGEISVTLSCADGRVRLVLRDGGRPFNPLDAPAPDLDLPVEERPVGGLGIHLVRTMMDDVRYVRGDGVNILTAEKSVTEAP